METPITTITHNATVCNTETFRANFGVAGLGLATGLALGLGLGFGISGSGLGLALFLPGTNGSGMLLRSWFTGAPGGEAGAAYATCLYTRLPTSKRADKPS